MLLTIIVAFISLIGLMVAHEFAHFIIAKKCGTKVEEFGVGYPPRLFGKKIGETIYSLNLIPFGAFVKVYGEEGGIEDYHSFSGKPLWQRFCIVLGGVVSFWLVAVIIMSVVEHSPLAGLEAVGKITIGVIKGWVLGIKNILGIAELPPGVKLELMGPLGIFGLLKDYFEMGINYFLFLVSLISVALALANLLPIPALDGGKILFLAIEAFRGKPLNHKLEQKITSGFFALLIILMIFVTVKFDIPRVF